MFKSFRPGWDILLLLDCHINVNGFSMIRNNNRASQPKIQEPFRDAVRGASRLWETSLASLPRPTKTKTLLYPNKFAVKISLVKREQKKNPKTISQKQDCFQEAPGGNLTRQSRKTIIKKNWLKAALQLQSHPGIGGSWHSLKTVLDSPFFFIFWCSWHECRPAVTPAMVSQQDYSGVFSSCRTSPSTVLIYCKNDGKSNDCCLLLRPSVLISAHTQNYWESSTFYMKKTHHFHKTHTHTDAIWRSTVGILTHQQSCFSLFYLQIRIRSCVHLLLFITFGVHSSKFEVNPVTDDISRLSILVSMPLSLTTESLK